jgi:hypothetical protein
VGALFFHEAVKPVMFKGSLNDFLEDSTHGDNQQKGYGKLKVFGGESQLFQLHGINPWYQ